MYMPLVSTQVNKFIWAAPSEFGTYRLCEQRRFRRACASAQSRQNLRCSLIQAVSQEEPSDRKPDPWPLWMAGHAQLKFVMTECSKTQIRLAGLIWSQSANACIEVNKKDELTCQWFVEVTKQTKIQMIVTQFTQPPVVCGLTRTITIFIQPPHVVCGFDVLMVRYVCQSATGHNGWNLVPVCMFET